MFVDEYGRLMLPAENGEVNQVTNSNATVVEREERGTVLDKRSR